MTRNTPEAGKHQQQKELGDQFPSSPSSSTPNENDAAFWKAKAEESERLLKLQQEELAEVLSRSVISDDSKALAHVQTNDDDDENDSDEHRLKDFEIIFADLLIPGKGEPSYKKAVVIGNGKILSICDSASLPSKYYLVPTKTWVPVLMPGMWDCHVHLMGTTSLDFSELATGSPIAFGARLTRSCRDILMSGFTSVRDLGGHACEVAQVVEEGTILGPNIYSAGAAISQTAGHGDLFNLPIGWVYSKNGVNPANHDSSQIASPLCLADGPTEVLRAIRLQVRRGAATIKVLASGGVLSLSDDPHHAQFSPEELSIIVAEAARSDRAVTAHVHGAAGIRQALNAGVHCLEHGTYLDEELVDLMVEKDVMLVATRTIVLTIIKNLDILPPATRAKALETARHHLAAYRLAIQRGVKIALGTDLGVSVPNHPLSHGQAGQELVHAVDAGMSPLEAIEAATANGPLTLGPRAPRKGRIEEGWDADLIAVARDPLEDIRVFEEGEKSVTHVWKAGRCVKAPGLQLVF
ncbi:hypothetical protein K402DRAFT_332493 [Aulographum hederae CBS 113979]|uniref:Amidohydrolase-related domain-containing protein n=1 Tax=Aulographum hederae CBS 113979 TaxID=1176131 RepID=A0A6G1H085_9PEZI|nr:hypothetical protein K402DRAFT_332493 [Aulographum hederae CBS 113979]